MTGYIVLQNVLLPLGMMAMVVLIIWLSQASRGREQDRRADLIRLIVEKFSSGEAFARALEGPEGPKLTKALSLESDKPPRKTWPGLFIPASILSFLGLAFFVLAFVVTTNFMIPAIIVGAIGAALALSTYAIWRSEERERLRSSSNDDEGVESTGAHSTADRL